MPTCPNCGYKQPNGEKCQKCSSLFSYYTQSELQQRSHDQETLAPLIPADVSTDTAASGQGFFISWRTAYKIASRICLVLLLLVVFLIFRKSSPPKVPVSPQAAASAATKISQAVAAAQQDQPHQVTLSSTELNSFLNSNLQLQDGQPNSSGMPTASGTTANPPIAANPSGPAESASSSAEPTLDDVQSAVKDVQVNLVGDLVKAYVTFDFHGKDMSLELDGHLSSENGYLKFEPTSGQLGSLPLPQSVLDAAVDKLMSSPENREKLRLPPGVNSIKIVDGQVVMN